MNQFLNGMVAALIALSAMPACAPTMREPVFGPVPRAEASAAAPSPDTLRPNVADTQFMQHMIVHHAQGLVMTELVTERTENEQLWLLAERIELSQNTEIGQMQRWLVNHGREVPKPDPSHAQHGAGAHHSMPGMLTNEELAKLSQSRGSTFDRLFLELMIQHHEGALVMVGELFGSQGAAQNTEVFQIASEVDADQRAEISRMRVMLEALPGGSAPGR